MATPGAWQPAEEGVRDICTLLQEYLKPGVDQGRIFQQLESCRQFPDFNNYLTYILCRVEAQPVEVRQSAGLLLKNNLKTGYAAVAPPYQQYIKSELLPSIGLADRQLRSTVGTSISVVVQKGGLQAWPEILQALAQCLDSNDFNHMEGALDTLYKVCEEMPEELDRDLGVAERPVNVFLPRFLQLFKSDQESLRRLALACVNQFLTFLPYALMANMDAYLQGLFVLANDSSPEVRRLVCSALVQLLEVQVDVLQPHMKNVIEYMLHATEDTNEDVALEACEFWSTYCEAHVNPELLVPYLSRLLPILFKNMVYADDDEALLEVEDEDAPDRDQDLKPRFHHSKLHATGDEVAEEQDDDDDIVSVWSLRKCSAAGLDSLSTVYRDNLLPMLMPLLEARLQAQGDTNWKEREAGVLAVGAVAEGCINGMLPALPQMISALLPLLEDARPLVRSITCWTLSRFSKWIVKAVEAPSGQAQFDAVLAGLLRRILDPSKRVQEAACSAFATLEEEAAEELPARLDAILQHLMFAFGKYQRKNLRILYDAIGTLADCVGEALNETRHLQVLMPPLVDKWQQLADTDKDLFPLFECFTSIAQALASGFSPYAQPVFGRCLTIIRTQRQSKVDPAQSATAYDKDFVVVSLDLLSGLVEGLGPSIESLVGRSDLRDLLLQCCADEDTDVRQSSLALLGDLAKACAVHLQPHIGDFLSIAAQQLQQAGQNGVAFYSLSVTNNACWAIGELAVKLKGEVAPVALHVVGCLVPILTATEGVNKPLVENSAITLGRLGWVCPQAVAPHLDHFVQPWCRALRLIRDDVEKEDAFRGMCAMLRLNPGAGAQSLASICQAIGSWNEIYSADLREEVTQVLQGYKQMLQGGAWEQCMASLEPNLVLRLHNKYGV